MPGKGPDKARKEATAAAGKLRKARGDRADGEDSLGAIVQPAGTRLAPVTWRQPGPSRTMKSSNPSLKMPDSASQAFIVEALLLGGFARHRAALVADAAAHPDTYRVVLPGSKKNVALPPEGFDAWSAAMCVPAGRCASTAVVTLLARAGGHLREGPADAARATAADGNAIMQLLWRLDLYSVDVTKASRLFHAQNDAGESAIPANVPCHRVVYSNGQLSRAAGEAEGRQAAKLQEEGVTLGAPNSGAKTYDDHWFVRDKAQLL